MRRITVILGLCALLLPMAAWADAIELTNVGGSVTFSSSGISSTMSELKSFKEGAYSIVAPKSGSLGTVSFSTGAFISGGIWTGGTLSATGSTFDVAGSGRWARILTGQSTNPVTLFTGSFVGPISWTVISHVKDNYIFTLSGRIFGLLYTGRDVSGFTTQTIYAFTNQEPYDHKGSLHAGSTSLPIPEPGTLGLLGTGLIAVAGSMRRKLFGS